MAKYITNGNSILEEVKAKGYEVITSGCAEATEFLGGEPSACLECPFYPNPCIHEKSKRGRPRNTERDREIVSSNKTVKELSIKYNLTEHTIKGIIKKAND